MKGAMKTGETVLMNGDITDIESREKGSSSERESRGKGSLE